MLKDTLTSFGWITIFAHWLTAFTIIGLFAVGLWMVDLDYYSQWYTTAPHYHQSAGLLLALVIVLRLVWKLTQTSPHAFGKNWEKYAAKATHRMLYVLIIGVLISGYLISTADGRGIVVFNWFTLPSLGEFIDNQEDKAGELHEWFAYGVIGLSSLHALAAFKHHIVDKDLTLIRMLKPQLKHSKQQKDI